LGKQIKQKRDNSKMLNWADFLDRKKRPLKIQGYGKNVN
jgi:hypothetical protein